MQHVQTYSHLYRENPAISFNDFLDLVQDVVELCQAVDAL